ncbi:hypothetical protein QTI33_09120 [Variovorax sp. J22P271]|uniref:hypothetical protein n=1 Tax=Variovorax davisae TaxID=3053515 RepID=UPI002576DF0C|nr:hypothetical protein [Variovorax sp. J22P271]MDM0032288.1 hypothetical protein [Variovorax sp. J22P271]
MGLLASVATVLQPMVGRGSSEIYGALVGLAGAIAIFCWLVKPLVRPGSHMRTKEAFSTVKRRASGGLWQQSTRSLQKTSASSEGIFLAQVDTRARSLAALPRCRAARSTFKAGQSDRCRSTAPRR